MFLNQHTFIRVIRRTIHILTEKNIPVSCGNTVSLEAFLYENNILLIGETPVEWEQLTGAPVIWATPINLPQITFTQPAIRDDKIFRIHVYRNTVNHVYMDVLVTAIPTDILVSNMYSNKADTSILGYLNGFTISDITPHYIDSDGTIGYALYINSDHSLVPHNLRTIFSVYRISGSTLNKVQDIEVHGMPPPSIPVYGLSTGTSYFVRRFTNSSYLDSEIKSHYPNNINDTLQSRLDTIPPSEIIVNTIFEHDPQAYVSAIFSPSILPVYVDDMVSTTQYTHTADSSITYISDISLHTLDMIVDDVSSTMHSHTVPANITYVAQTSGSSLG